MKVYDEILRTVDNFEYDKKRYDVLDPLSETFITQLRNILLEFNDELNEELDRMLDAYLVDTNTDFEQGYEEGYEEGYEQGYQDCENGDEMNSSHITPAHW